MMQTMWGLIHEGRIELFEPANLSEGAKAIVTLLPEDASRFWADASQKSLAAIWDNAEDDAFCPAS